jgi:hypothetical protein
MAGEPEAPQMLYLVSPNRFTGKLSCSFEVSGCAKRRIGIVESIPGDTAFEASHRST